MAAANQRATPQAVWSYVGGYQAVFTLGEGQRGHGGYNPWSFYVPVIGSVIRVLDGLYLSSAKCKYNALYWQCQ